MSDNEDDILETGADSQDEAVDATTEEEPKEVVLDEGHLRACLSQLGQTNSGLAQAYVKFDASAQGYNLTDASRLAQCKFLRFVNVNNNKVSELGFLGNLDQLTVVSADANRLVSCAFAQRLFLQKASFANNKITDFQGLDHPRLATLNLNGNQISSCDTLIANKLGNLTHLELRSNLLTSLKSLKHPTLAVLFAANNNITSLEGLDSLPALKKLHLRDNPVTSLDGVGTGVAPALEYLNLRGTQVPAEEIAKIAALAALKMLVLADTPAAESGSYRVDALVANKQLQRLDKDGFEIEERREAAEIAERREAEQRAAEREQRQNQGTEEVVADA